VTVAELRHAHDELVRPGLDVGQLEGALLVGRREADRPGDGHRSVLTKAPATGPPSPRSRPVRSQPVSRRSVSASSGHGSSGSGRIPTIGSGGVRSSHSLPW
jgi:hypothetical protein